jgi:hypothetical protein
MPTEFGIILTAKFATWSELIQMTYDEILLLVDVILVNNYNEQIMYYNNKQDK